MTDFLTAKPMNQTLKNHCALVTGGSRAIGAAILKRLASEGSQAAQAFGVHALAIQAGSADAGAVVAVVERTASELGGLDILVNNGFKHLVYIA